VHAADAYAFLRPLINLRQALASKRPIKKFVPASVEEYIKKEGLYGS